MSHHTSSAQLEHESLTGSTHIETARKLLVAAIIRASFCRPAAVPAPPPACTVSCAHGHLHIPRLRDPEARRKFVTGSLAMRTRALAGVLCPFPQ